MTRSMLFIAALLAAAPLAPAQAQRAAGFSDYAKGFITTDAPRIAIRDVRVVPGDGSLAREGQTVLVRDGRIERIGANLPIPRDAKVIDGKGLTALPGLVMLHEHLYHGGEVQWTYPGLYLAHGMTTIRTAGALAPLEELRIKRDILEGLGPGPDIDITGPYVEGPGSWIPTMTPVGTPEEARRSVAFWAAQGATSFKAYNTVSREVLAAAIDETHRHGLKITGHLCSVTFGEAADLGIDNLEHGLIVASDFVEGKQPDACPFNADMPVPDAAARFAELDLASPDVQALIRKLVEKGVAVTSTLAAFASLGTEPPRPEALAVLADGARAYILQMKLDALVAEKTGKKSLFGKPFDVAVKKEMEFERAFVAAGGLLVSGTDFLAGFDSIRQVELLVEAGFTPLEALKISSYNGAKYLERLDRIGTLEPGKQADIVLVRGEPDIDITDLRNIETVFRDGIGYDSAKMIDSAKGKVGL